MSDSVDDQTLIALPRMVASRRSVLQIWLTAAAVLAIGFVAGRLSNGRSVRVPSSTDTPVMVRDVIPDTPEVAAVPAAARDLNLPPELLGPFLRMDLDTIRKRLPDFAIWETSTDDDLKIWKFKDKRHDAIFSVAGFDETHLRWCSAAFKGDSPLGSAMYVAGYMSDCFSVSPEVNGLVSGHARGTVGRRIPIETITGGIRFTAEVVDGKTIVRATPEEFAWKVEKSLPTTKLIPLNFGNLRQYSGFHQTDTRSLDEGRSWVWDRDRPGITIAFSGNGDSEISSCTILAIDTPEANGNGDDMLVAIYYLAQMADAEPAFAGQLRQAWRDNPTGPVVHHFKGVKVSMSVERGISKLHAERE